MNQSAQNISDEGPVTLSHAILFDCDGVLVDSRASAEKAWAAWAVDHGIDPDEVIAVMHGRRAADTVASFIPPAEAAAAQAKIDRMEIEAAGEVTAIPGAAELVASIPHTSWAVVTSASPDLVRARLRGAGLPLPKTLITSADIENGKPSPDPYLAGAAALGIDSGDAIVLEDSEAGIKSGLAAKAHMVVGVGEEAVGLGADLVVPDLTAIRWQEARA
ncbi:MAG: HAD-IA family hydrolase [Solirubrobacterales bacterium]